ncbi:MAG: 5'-deoxynucleotidase [Clostridia bacterium]|jgi:5'-deoxynucleotidase|nr:5'-deoxynucleotidase [Clostridia bacterium]
MSEIYSFYAMMSRIKYIHRWGLMKNTRNENLSEHSLEVAMVAHALGVINNKRFDGSINPERLAVLAMFHDVSEIITGDLPTPVKYDNRTITNAYKELEEQARLSLLKMLPDDIAAEYKSILCENEDELLLWKYVKAADTISALIKCTEELIMGNAEYSKIKQSKLRAIEKIDLPEVKVFMQEMFPAYELTLDEQK